LISLVYFLFSFVNAVKYNFKRAWTKWYRFEYLRSELTDRIFVIFPPFIISFFLWNYFFIKITMQLMSPTILGRLSHSHGFRQALVCLGGTANRRIRVNFFRIFDIPDDWVTTQMIYGVQHPRKKFLNSPNCYVWCYCISWNVDCFLIFFSSCRLHIIIEITC
jgi:hypothetical protein